MSEWYRDDVQATAVLADGVRFGFVGRLEAVLRVADGVGAASGLWWQDWAHIGAAVCDAAVLAASAAVRGGGTVYARTLAAAVCAGSAAGRGMAVSPQVGCWAASARVGDFVRSDDVSVLFVAAALREAWHTSVAAPARFADGAGVRDSVGLLFAGVVSTGTAGAAGAVFCQARQSARCRDVLNVSAAASALSVAVGRVRSSVRAVDVLSVRVRAGNVFAGTASAWGDWVRDRLPAQAWTAETDGWAVSRYAPLPFSGWAVADGKLLAWGDDGLYVFSETADAPDAFVQTGLIDVSGGVLARLSDVFLEYAADAAAELTVRTLQNGTAADFVYRLPRETAQVLTSGRFVLGRGLRGRHFALRLAFAGGNACVNDMVLRVAALKRRI